MPRNDSSSGMKLRERLRPMISAPRRLAPCCSASSPADARGASPPAISHWRTKGSPAKSRIATCMAPDHPPPSRVDTRRCVALKGVGMPQFIFTMKDLRKVTPQGKEILKGIWLSFYAGAKIGVLGHNGAGKSTLLRIMAGLDHDVAGEAVLAEGATVGLLPQEPALDASKTVREVVEEGAAATRDLLNRFETISMRLGEPMSDDEMEKLLAEQGRLQDRIDAANAWELDRQLEVAMDALRCPPPDAPVAPLSGGERRRVALCRLLIQQPDLLLLDEPTNHLDAESVAWLERHLQEYAGTVVAVTHDRYFLD